ncbi:hypothetical protein [Candidatus Leptofilum sp.]|uniref:hypothetical protein n=1 Tax=Candidatus Leptofilum sp. TaxID=3241576 RepID=UPI003B5C88C2
MAKSKLNDHLLMEFMETFYGFGNYAGKYWLVGMEEAGGQTVEAIQSRLTQWQKNGRSELEDLPTHAQQQGWGEKYFGKKPKWQRTWGKLIRLILAAERIRKVDTAVVKQFQREKLGRYNSNHCLLELLPLPAPSTSHWIYAQYSKLPSLQSRKAYRQQLALTRIAHLRQRLQEHCPQTVIFYGWSYRDWWQQVVERPFTQQENPKCLVAVQDGTYFFVIPHPTARGVTNRYFEQVGAQIATIGG